MYLIFVNGSWVEACLVFHLYKLSAKDSRIYDLAQNFKSSSQSHIYFPYGYVTF